LGHRVIQAVSFLAAALILSPPALATEDLFQGWTMAELFPGMFAYATQAYHALGPLAWLIIGFFVADAVIVTIWLIVKRASGGDDA
jgi:hypothetical protein